MYKVRIAIDHSLYDIEKKGIVLIFFCEKNIFGLSIRSNGYQEYEHNSVINENFVTVTI